MAAKIWEVVGGASAGGLVVRSGKDLKSPELPGRLATGSTVEQVELQGQRLHFRRLTGAGPESGWVSLQFKDTELLVPKAANVDLKGARVWLVTNGSRGDMQPILALACGVRSAGGKVRIFSSNDHGPFVTSFGFEFTGMCDGQNFLRRAVLESMPKEEMEELLKSDMMGQWEMRVVEGEKMVMRELVKAPPDLLICAHMHHGLRLIAWRLHGVRSLLAHVAYETFEESTAMYHRYHRALALDRSLVEDGISSSAVLQDISFEAFCLDLTSERTMNGVTSLYKEHLDPQDRALADKLNLMGNWVLRDLDGVEDPRLFGGAGARDELQRFIGAGTPPVYVGFGSCSPFADPCVTVFVIVMGLKTNNLRAVFLGGFGEHSLKDLELASERWDPTGAMKIVPYAKTNVLFMNSAPHEWLMRRCSATVHHGGAGTTAAALRAGVPTIIMPVGYDQFDAAKWMEELGCGIECRPSNDNFDPQTFIKALRKVSTDAKMKARAKEVGEISRREAGVPAALAMISEAWQEVNSGAAKTRWEAERAERQHVEEAAQGKRKPHLQELFNFCSLLVAKRGQELVPQVRAVFQLEAGDGGPGDRFVLDLKSGSGEVRWGEATAADSMMRLADAAWQGFAVGWREPLGVHLCTESRPGVINAFQEHILVDPLPQRWQGSVRELARFRTA